MTDTPRNTPRAGAAGPSLTDPTQTRDLSGVSEIFGLRDGQIGGDNSNTLTATATAGQSAAVTVEAIAQRSDGIGRTVHGRYRLIAELGVGGMGVTYRAWDTATGIPVVVKMPRSDVRHDSAAMQRFAREIEAMLATPHESVVPITDHGDDNGCPFVAMRFLPGGSLADYRRRDEAGHPIRNPPGMLHFWLPGVAAALDHIHARGMLHRDVKPGNIFLDGFLKPYLGDFGIAKIIDESGGLNKEQTLTATKMVVGTPEYMAPELFKPRANPDGRVDQYALAVTVYEMLSGEKPFKGERAHIIVEHSSLNVPPLAAKVPGLSQRLCAAVEKGLAKNAADRFATCREFAAAVVAELAPLAPEPDTVRLLCPGCKNILKLPQKAAGKTGRCPRCREAMDVAADLGSLWLEAEERGVGADKLVEPTPSGTFQSDEPEPATGSTQWRAVHWLAIMSAALVGLVAGYVWGGSALKAENRRLTAALAAGGAAAQPAVEAAPSPRSVPDGGVDPVANSIGMSLIKIPMGEFKMGERTNVRVRMSRDFLLGQTEVTRGQWEKVMGTKPWGGAAGESGDTLPAVQMTWDEANRFCEQLTTLERANGGLPKAAVYRLPTEAEWEYACRAGTTTAFSCGDDESTLGDFAWFSGNSEGTVHPVGAKQPNAWGLHDMHGNVREWCSDWQSGNLQGGFDPAGPATGSDRVSRGGSWGDQPSLCRSAYRGLSDSASRSVGNDSWYRSIPHRSVNLGFRVARSPSGR